jgi:hypothetical protein
MVASLKPKLSYSAMAATFDARTSSHSVTTPVSDFINEMLQQRSPSPALKRGIDGDIKQRRLIQHHLRNGESRHHAINRRIVQIALALVTGEVCSLHGKRGRVFNRQALVKSAVVREEIVFIFADLLP